MTKKILLINDFPGYGKVAVSAAMPIFVRHRFELFTLPTMLVSNTLNYGKFASVDTTGYIKESVKVWNELGFRFDAISTGFIANDEQAEFISDFCKEQAESGALIFNDPIMADNGKLYNSITENRVNAMKRIIASSDYSFPNLTEACFLSGVPYNSAGYKLEEIYGIADSIHCLGSKSVVITSTSVKQDNNSVIKAVIGYDGIKNCFFSVEYDEMPFKINGSGDIFSAVVTAEIMNGSDLETSVNKAVKTIRKLIEHNSDIAEEYNGLPIEHDMELF